MKGIDHGYHYEGYPTFKAKNCRTPKYQNDTLES